MPNTDRTLTISRVFPAPRDLVFKPWSSAGRIRRWFAPETYTSALKD